MTSPELESIEAGRYVARGKYRDLAHACPLFDRLLVLHVRADGQIVDCRAPGRESACEAHNACTHLNVKRVFPNLAPELSDCVASTIRTQLPREAHIVSSDGTRERHFDVVSTPTDVDRAALVIRDVTDVVTLERRAVRGLEGVLDRLGQELHDEVGQYASGLSMLLEASHRRLVSSGSGEASEVRSIIEIYTEMLDHLRSIMELSHLLVPASASEAFEQLASRVARLFRIDCVATVDPTITMSSETLQHFCRIAQEAVHNAVRHGHAHSVQIELSNTSGVLTLRITDDGWGLRTRSPSSTGMGIEIMRSRAHQLGATIAFGKAEPHGTIVTVSLASDAA